MSEERSEGRWYVVQTHVHAERKAESHLRRQGFEAYAPRYLKTRRHARKTETVSAPLFPRYLFVKLSPATSGWRAVHSTLGVSRLVCFGDDPAPVGAGVVEALQAREDAQGHIEMGRKEEFQRGQAVEIVNGPLGDVDAIFELVDDKDRVVLLLDLLGRQVRVRIPLRDVRPAA